MTAISLRAKLIGMGSGAAVLGGVAAIVIGVLSSEGYLPGDGMQRVWEAPRDRDAADHGNASWLHGDVVVRSRFDSVTGYDVATGRKRWEYVVPGQAEICATGSTASRDGIAVVAFGVDGDSAEEGAGCTTAAAIDLKTGDELWRTPITSHSGRLDAEPDLVAVGGGLAVVRDTDPGSAYDKTVPAGEALRAVDARTGKPRWKAAVPKGCVPHRAGAGEKQVVAVLVCERTELRIAAFGIADGKALWSGPLDARRPVADDATVSLRSVEPLVVQVDAEQERGVHAFLAFGADGKPRGRIELTGEYGEIMADSAGKVVVTDDRLIAFAEYPYESYTRHQVVGFDLGTGEPVWRKGFEFDDAVALHAGGGRVTAMVSRSGKREWDEDLHVFDARTGEEKDVRSFSEDVDRIGTLGLHVHPGGLVIAVRWGDAVSPLSAYETW
ncbi:PQQ-binding-like beta-propeller repeat protein [Streptomyces sp. NPDC059875]|uniref:outer membrane protein assembly factor BamB family protein n=1 Tax=unclassified Streptomyces TaxID=2593676 RepID=UPI00365AC318